MLCPDARFYSKPGATGGRSRSRVTVRRCQTRTGAFGISRVGLGAALGSHFR